MELVLKLSDNLTINYAHSNNTKGGTLLCMELGCTFYGQDFLAWVTKSNIDNDLSSISGEGPSETFSSFIDQLEDTHWEKVKELFKKLQEEVTENEG